MASPSNCVDFASSSSSSTLLVSSPGSLSRSAPTSFVTRRGRKLYVDNAEFKAVGPNVYWLGLDENIDNAISYPTPGRVMEIMATAAAMGATAIRSTTLGVSVGSPLTISPTLRNFSDDALRVTDFAVYAARSYGIRLIIPLTDQYDYYHGGKLSFLRFRNLSTTDEGAFYTNTDVISDYKQYIGTIVNRTNIYTNTSYSDDPTILCWETGNELKDPPASWTEDITTYIKTLAPNQLTMDGAYGVQKDALDLPSVDLYSNHYYPPEKHKLNSDVKLVAAHNKAYYVGEYDWTDKYSRYGLFACLIPLIFVLVAFCLPGRWWPWTFYLPRWMSFKRSTGSSKPSYTATSASPGLYSPLHDVTAPLAVTGETARDGDGTNKDEGEYPPTLSSPVNANKYDGRRKVVIRKWMFALSFLLLVPFAAWIAIEVGPTSLSKFLSMVEDKEVVGSAYWSLFGRDNDCCQWVEHNDGFTIHYRQDKFMKRSLQLTQHAYRMSGAQAAIDLGSSTSLPVIGCPAAINLTSLAAGRQAA